MRTLTQTQDQLQRQSFPGPARLIAVSSGPNHDTRPILELRRTLGNQALQRLLQTNAQEVDEGSSRPADRRLTYDVSRAPTVAQAPVKIQPKLVVNAPGDTYEQEADRVVDQVMRVPDPGAPLLPRTATDPAEVATAPPIVHDVLRSAGQPLDPATRAFMEPRFGHDFGSVRVHTDAKAAESARAVNALAYTVGRDVVFGAGQYSPQSDTGQRLMAHELTHIVQQAGVEMQGLQRAGAEEEEKKKLPVETPPKTLADTAPTGAGTPTATPTAAAEVTDGAIDALDLASTAKAAAKELKKKHSDITFTSGRRGVSEQASAMAANIVSSKDRRWIEKTYKSAAALQKWVDDNPKATSQKDIAAGLEKTMSGMSDAERGKISKHLSGEAFDVQPQEKDAEAIIKDIKALPGLSKFLPEEGGLVRWHAQFKKVGNVLTGYDRFEQEADRVAEQVVRSPAAIVPEPLGLQTASALQGHSDSQIGSDRAPSIVQPWISSPGDRLNLANNLTIARTNDRSEFYAETATNALGTHSFQPPTLDRRNAVVLQRAPAPPVYEGQTGVFDRSKVAIGELPNIIAAIAGGEVILTPPTLTVTVAISDPDVTHLSWEIYDPSDKFVNGRSTTSHMEQATTLPLVFDGSFFNGEISQGRYALRCVGRRQGKPIVYVDRTFYVWTSAPTSTQDQASLTAIISSPAAHSLSEVGAAYARNMMLEHQQAVAATGTGKYMGTDEAKLPAGPTSTGVIREDCTTYVLEVLKHAFAAKGLSSDWKAIYDEAQRTSAGLFKGTELIKALETKAGWKAVFWAPDPRNPADARSEHPVAYKQVQSQGTYYDIPVDKTRSVVDYRPTSLAKRENMTRLDQLRQVSLAVIAAGGGDHMTLLLSGDVYAVHWEKKATDADVITASSLEKWEWQSGVVVMPSDSFNAAFSP